MQDKEVQGEVMTKHYSPHPTGSHPIVAHRNDGRDAARPERRSAVPPVETALMSTTTSTAPLARRERVASTSAWALMAARLLSASLDTKLALGVDPTSSEILSARAQQLASPSTRHSLAMSYLDLVDAAHAPLSPFSPVVPVVRRRVVAAEPLIREVAHALVSPLPRVRGIAMATSLLSDGAGPIFNPSSDSDLSSALQEVLSQIDPLETTNL
jgi:hypothetical protein